MPIRREFFELGRLPALSGRSWVALRQVTKQRIQPPEPDIFSGEEFTGIATAAVNNELRSKVDQFGWEELGIGPHRAGMESWGYHSADVFRTWTEAPLGVNLVIVQFLDELPHEIWHLHPDLLLALGLVQDGDGWFRPAEGWAEVVRLKRDDEGAPVIIEIRTEFLADYLAARDMSLLSSSYVERIAVTATKPSYDWERNGVIWQEGRDRLETTMRPAQYGEPEGSYWTRGAIWRTEWIKLPDISVRVRGDAEPETVTFILENDGGRAQGNNLVGAVTWLYFQPTLVSALLRHRGGALRWASEETGGVGATGSTVHFGVNALGLITVFAKDIGALPVWEQRLWGAHNVTPDGGVSRELFAAQMEVNPSSTTAPENELPRVLEALDTAFLGRFGKRLLRDHDSVPSLLRKAHRFQAAEADGLLELSKELTRLFAERVDVDAVVSQLTLPKGDRKPGSLKSVQLLVATLVPEADAATLMAPLFGIYDLRLADAHLGSSAIESGKQRAGVRPDDPPATQGKQLLRSFVDTLKKIADLLV